MAAAEAASAQAGEEPGSALRRRFASIKHVVLVLSGKGGVGKSTMTTQIALALVAAGKKVGVLDVDLCGPSIPKMLNLQGKDVHQCSEGWVPVYADVAQRLSCMSIGFLLGARDDPVVWRGPKKTAMIKQFLEDVFWGELDYLLIDTPPGTSDEHISIVEYLRECRPDGAVVVTTPQQVALADVRKELSFCVKANIRVLGVVENMSGFVCPHCAECTNVFSSGGGESLAAACKVPFLGAVPLDPQLTQSLEAGTDFQAAFPTSQVYAAVKQVVEPLLTLPARGEA